MRELLLEHLKGAGSPTTFGGAEILLAEAAFNALAKSHFSNLLDLEEYIAAIVASVLLIVESPGSMCELGAFVKTVEIREKLIVVVPSEFKNVPSFITKGALQYLSENYDKTQILGFDWKVIDQVACAPSYVLSKMLEDLPDAMQAVHGARKREVFRHQKTGHIIYLTLAFCHLLRAAKLTDIKACFIAAKIVVEEIAIKRCLDTLEICKLVKAVEHGKLKFYIARIERLPLDVSFRSGTPNRDRDTLRWIMRIKQSIEVEEAFRIEMFREHHNG